MTKAVCHIVLQYSIAKLSWKTVKSLRQSRSCVLKNSHDESPPIEFEILQGWTLLAFHSIYVAVGLEAFVRILVPFYFHLKMMVLFATFLMPTWTMLSTPHKRGQYELSPVISLWFDFVIVPGVQKLHQCMDHDPKRWLKDLLTILPLLVIDYFIFPGILFTNDLQESIYIDQWDNTHNSHCRREENLVEDNCNMHFNDTKQAKIPEEDDNQHMASVNHHQSKKIQANETLSQRKEQRDDIIDMPAHTQYCSPQAPESESEIEFLSQSDTPNEFPWFPKTTPTSSPRRAHKLQLSPLARSRLTASALRLRRFSRDNQCQLRSTDNQCQTSIGREFINLESDAFLVKKPHNGVEILLEANEERGCEVDRSYVDTIAVDENRPNRLVISPLNKVREMRKGRRKRSERQSLGDQFRELVTGDANIRLRDHLFDLQLPSAPSISPGRKLQVSSTKRNDISQKENSAVAGCSSNSSKDGSRSQKRTSGRNAVELDTSEPPGISNVTTRRSRRLAKSQLPPINGAF